jgi:hypothetical protein
MAQPYTNIVGTPPNPKTGPFLNWVDNLITQRINYCNKPRAATYYFSQSGNDTNNGLTPATAKKSISAANGLVGSGNVALLFHQGDTWTDKITLSDGGNPNVTFGSYSDATVPSGSVMPAKPIMDGNNSGSNTNVDGIIISGDGSMVQGIISQNWGSSGTQQYPIKLAQTQNNAGLVIDCEAYNGGLHNIAGYLSGGAGLGGIWTVINCFSGKTVATNGTIFNFYADNGGYEFICDGCQVRGVAATGSQIGCYSHTQDFSHFMALGIVRNLHIVRDGLYYTYQVTQSIGSAAIPDNGFVAANSRFFEIGTTVDYGATECPPGMGQSSGVSINCLYNNKLPDVGSTRTFAVGPPNKSFSYNCVYILDMTNIDNSDVSGWWNTGGTGTGSFVWENCHVHYLNAGTGTFIGFEYGGIYGGNSSVTAGTLIINSIFTAELKLGTIRIGLGTVSGAATTKNNAYYGVSEEGNSTAYDLDPTPYNLPYLWEPLYQPHVDLLLLGKAVLPPDNIPLGYDFNFQARPTTYSIGPVEKTNISNGGGMIIF